MSAVGGQLILYHGLAVEGIVLHQAGARGGLAGGLKGLGNLLYRIVQAVNARSVDRRL